jgi:hypothetical protein
VITTLLAILAFGFSPDHATGADNTGTTNGISVPEQFTVSSMQQPEHDVALEGCSLDGSTVVNISDTVGAYLYVYCEAINLSGHDDQVNITAAGDLLTSDPPSGCTSTTTLLVPGQTEFVLLPEERKHLFYRIRVECHAPAVPGIFALTVTVAIDHITEPGGPDDGNPENDSATLTRNIIIADAPPTPTPTPAPPLDTDGDTLLDEVDSDDDNDWVFDLDERSCGGDPLDSAKRPERLDTPEDDDGDTALNEPLPDGSGPFDCDGDGWTGDEERLIYGYASSTVSDQDPCGSNGWSADLNGDDNTLNAGDMNSFIFPMRADGSLNKIGHPVPDPNDLTIARWNLKPDATIDISDLNALNPSVQAPTSRPAMFGGKPAFFTNAGHCPWPP